MTNELTGQRFEVEPDELFFSTTDTKGVIELANDVFTRLSRFDRDDLRGAPHNIVRHPDMPAGVFALMWQRIGAGLPFAGYIRNRAADGSAYDVFATVTPLPADAVEPGYLSVRSRPCHERYYALVAAIYGQVRDHEEELRAGGKNRREVAAAGAVRLNELVVDAGFESYQQFQDTLVAAEVAQRAALTEPFPYREGNTEIHLMLEEIWSEYAIVTTWRDRVEAELTAGAQTSPVHVHLATTECHISMCGFFLAELIETGYDAKIGIPGEAVGFASRTIWDEPDEESDDERDVRERLEAIEMLSQVLMADLQPLRTYAEGSNELAELEVIIDRVHAKVLMMEGAKRP